MLSFTVLFQECKKETTTVTDPNPQLTADKKIIADHVAAHQLQGSYTSSGMFYTILKEGPGVAPSYRNGVYVKYKEKLLDGTVYDSSATMYQFGLGQNFAGYNMAMALLKDGGSGRFIIPSDYVFGAATVQRKNISIPARAVIELDLDMVKVVSEDVIIPTYLQMKNISATKTASGLYYYITKAGTGTKVLDKSTVTVKYSGSYLNDIIFDPGTDPLTFQTGTNAVVTGFDEGIQLLKQGDKAVLLIPHNLGYGAAGNGGIPGYAILKFTVEITAVN